ncbi:MAG: nuclear transport factor 2 family protein [Actinobacteria bacterium]|nr:MAG: nuclear transport factor 2 family protein [Actinomycetota bacterium]
MSDEEGIRRTLALYCQLCDDGRFDEWAQLYTEDAVFRVMGQVHVGPAAIKAFIAEAQPEGRRGKHVAVPGEGQFPVTSAGRYHDRLVRRNGAWLFAERQIVFMGEDPPDQPSSGL